MRSLVSFACAELGGADSVWFGLVVESIYGYVAVERTGFSKAIQGRIIGFFAREATGRGISFSVANKYDSTGPSVRPWFLCINCHVEALFLVAARSQGIPMVVELCSMV